MIEKNEQEIAWSLYWAQNKLHSCVAANFDSDQEVLNNIWCEFTELLKPQATVLDLATGNGAVPVALLSANADLKIDAVDQADIDPAQYVKDQPELLIVNFKAKIDINDLPIDEKRYDTITSQFGVEYAGLSAAAQASLKCLRPNGSFQFIIHHSDSEIIKASSLRLEEMVTLLAPEGIIDSLLLVLKGEMDFSSLEDCGRRYLESPAPRSDLISGQVFTGIERIAALIQSDLLQAQRLGATIKLRLQADHDRLTQMIEAAQTEDEINLFCSQLEKNGFRISTLKPVYVNDVEQKYLLAWQIQGAEGSLPNDD